MQECYHQECNTDFRKIRKNKFSDNNTFATGDSSSANDDSKFADVRFLKKTCQALIDSMVSYSFVYCNTYVAYVNINLLGKLKRIKVPIPISGSRDK